MAVRKVAEGVYSVGVIDWHRRLFDELIPLPYGTTYNSYLIMDEKITLIDTVDTGKEEELLSNLKELGVDRIDYIIAQHAEQDHSGSIPAVLEAYPMARVVTNAKCKSMLIDLLPLKEENFIEIKDGEELDMGKRKLKFIFAPWVHWPETMLTYSAHDGILFTCDFLGSHYSTSELFARDEQVYVEAKRYYAEIMMPFRKQIKKHLEKIKELDIKYIAPSHGPIYEQPEKIIRYYEEWVGDEVKNEVIIAFVSMHGSVRKAVEVLENELIEKGIIVKPFDLIKADIGEIAISLVDAATVIIAAPTVLGGTHPVAIYAAYLVNALRPKTKFAGLITSYGWGGKMEQHMLNVMPNLKVELFPTLMIKGYPKEEDIKKIKELAEEIARKHREAGLMN